jgi:serine/threonine protein kinase
MLEAVAHYRILESLGRGPLGELYRARDTRLGRTVTVTVVADAIAADATRRGEFLEDARRAVALSHPNIAAIYEVGDDGAALFLASEFVAGQPLSTLTAGHAMNARRAIDYGTQIADALAEAHAAGMADGALTPDRIVITARGNAKILDFGFAAWTTAAKGDEEKDLWAFGLILYQMLTGRQPRAGWPAPPPSSVNRNVPRELDAVLGRLLSMNKAERYETAATASAELRACGAVLDVRAGEAEPPTLVRPRSTRSLRAAWVAVAIAVAAALVWVVLRVI